MAESQEIIVAKTPRDVTPMALLDRALAGGAEVETLEKLLDMQERWEKNQARKDFYEAKAAAKAAIPAIKKNREGHNGKRYADFYAFASVVDPILAEHGLSYSFRTRQDDRIHVTCVLFHRAGHCEENTLSGPPDTTGNKNAVQAIGSTVTYLQRYTLGGALGLAATDEDDDGQGAGSGSNEPITDDQWKALCAKADETNADIAKMCEYLKIDSLRDLPQRRLHEAEAMLSERAKIIAQKRSGK